MSGIQQTVTVPTTPVLPAAPKEDGGKKKGEGRAGFRASRGRAGSQGVETMPGNGKVIESILESSNASCREVQFHGVQRPRGRHAPEIEVSASLPDLGGEAVGEKQDC